MYKLEERVLFDAALPVDIAEAADAVDQQEQQIDETDDSSYDSSQVFDSFDDNSDVTDEASSTSELAALVDSLSEIPDESLTNELYIIDTSVPGYENLMSNIPEGAQVEMLDINSDGIESITEILEGYDDLDALHILSHGSSGKLHVGDDVVSTENLSLYAKDFSSWGDSLSEGGDILLYGCNIAESPEGKDLVASVSALTKADVAASVDATGITGNWNLEFTQGSIEAITVYAEDYKYNLANYSIVVDTTTDVVDANDGLTSLREALALAEANKENTYTITFDMDALDAEDGINDGKSTLTLNSQLTVAGANIVIEGDVNNDLQEDITIQRGVTGNTRFMEITSGSVTINGVVIDNFKTDQHGAAFVVNSSDSTLNLNYSTVSNSSSTWGSSVAWILGGGSFNANWSEFINNKATGSGAIILAQGSHVVNVSNSYFGNNTTGGPSIFRGFYGAMNFTNVTVDNGANANAIFFAQNAGTFNADNVTFINSTGLVGTGSDASGVINVTDELEYDDADSADYVIVDGVRFINKGDGATTGAYAGVVEDDTAPAVDDDGDVRNSYSYENGGNSDGSYDLMDPSNPLFTDADDDELTLSIVYDGDGSAPGGITFDGTEFKIGAGTPAGVYEYIVTADDGFKTTSTTVTITVTAPNQAPTVPGQSISGSDTAAVGDTVTGGSGSLLVGATDDGDIADLYIASVNGNLVDEIDGYTETITLSNGDIVEVTVFRDGSYSIAGVDTLDASDVNITGAFVITVADAENLESNDIAVSVRLNGADEPVYRMEVTTGEDDDDTIGFDLTGKSIDDVVAELGADGLSLREAIWVSEQFDDFPEVITFNSQLRSLTLNSDLVISSDVTIIGNGANDTVLSVGGQIIINSGAASDVDVNFKDIRISGNTSAKALFAVNGSKIDDNSAAIANVTFENVEIVDHIGSSNEGGVFDAEFAALKLNNVFISNISVEIKNALIDGRFTTLDMNGVTIDNISVADSGDYIFFGQMDNRDAKGDSLTMGDTFKEGLSSSFDNVTFNDINISSSTKSKLFTFQSDTALTNHLNNVTIAGETAGLYAFSGAVTFTGNGSQSTTTVLTEVAGTRDGVRYYSDGFSGYGADDLAGYTDDVADIDIGGNDTSGADDRILSDDENNLLIRDGGSGTIVIDDFDSSNNTVTVRLTDKNDLTYYDVILTITLEDGSYVISGIDQIPEGVIAGGTLNFEVDGESRELNITVVGANDTPVSTSNTDTITINTGSTKEIDLSQYFTDADGDELTYTLHSVSGGADITYHDGELIIADGVAGGNYILTFIASDGTVIVTDTISVKVTQTVISDSGNSDKGTVEDSDEKASGDLTIVDSDFKSGAEQPSVSDKGYGSLSYTLDGDTLSWEYTLDSDNPSINALAAGETITDTFTVVAIDGTKHQVTITITGSNDAPNVERAPSDQVVYKGGTKDFNPAEYFSDADGDAMTYDVVVRDGNNNVVSGIKYNDAKGIFEIGDSVVTGNYTVTVTARDSNGAGVSTAFTMSVQNPVTPPDFSENRVFITVTTGDDDDDTINAKGTTLEELVAELGSDGLSLREALYIANTIEGTEYIVFHDSVTNVTISSDLTISSDVFIYGNGADKTSITIDGRYTNIAVQTDGSEVNVSFEGLRFVGSGSEISSTAMIHINGEKIDDNTAYFANVTFESVEFVDHTTDQSEAALRSLYGNLTMRNVYFGNIHAQSRNVLSAFHTKADIKGMTIDGLTTTAGNWKNFIGSENRDSHSGSAMSASFKSSLHFSISDSTITNSIIGSDSHCYYFSFLTDATESHTVENVVFAGNRIGTNGQIYKQGGITLTAVNLHEVNTALTDVSTRSGVRYYADGFSTAGADLLDDYTAPVTDNDGSVRDKYVYSNNGYTPGEFHILSSVNPLFTDADGDHLYIRAEYIGDGMNPGSRITITNGGKIIVDPSMPDGVYTYRLTAYDGKGGVTTSVFTIFVVAEGSPNVAPEYTPVENDNSYLHSITPGNEGTTTIKVADWFDRHGNDFVIEARLANGAALPSWIIMNPDGSFTIDESAAPIGGTVLHIVQTATETNDGSGRIGLSQSYAFSITINHTPVASAPSNPANTNVNISAADGNYTYIDVSDYFSDSDSNSVLTYVVLDADGNAVEGISIDANGRLIIDESSVAYGDSAVTVTVTDQHGLQASFNFVIRAEGPVATNLEVGESHGTAQYFDYFYDSEGSGYTMKLITSSGALVDLPDGVSIDPDTGEITFALHLPQQQYSFYVSRIGITTDANGNPVSTVESREIQVTAVASTTAIIIDDVYIARNGGTIADALEKAINDVAEGGTITFDLSENYIQNLPRPPFYNADFDGDGDADIYIALKSDLVITKSMTINFDTDAKTGDRDVILLNYGFKIVGRSDTIKVNLSQFTVSGARDAVYINGADVTITDADFTRGGTAVWVDQTEMNYTNILTLNNINVYENYAENSGREWDQGVIYARNMTQFTMNNAFIGSNQYVYSLVSVSGSNTITNVTIADNLRVGSVRGRFINGGNWTNVTIVDNDVRGYKDWQGNYQVPDFLSGSFKNALIVGNLMTYWVDDPSTPDKIKDDAYTGVNVSVIGGDTGTTDNTYSTKDELLALITGESSDKYLNGNGKRSIYVVDGVIHYAESIVGGADSNTEYDTKYTGSAVAGRELAEVLEDARNEQYRSFDKESAPVEEIIASDGVEKIDYDKANGTSTIDVTKFFTPYDSTSTVQYSVKFYDPVSGAYTSTPPAGVSFNAQTGILTYTNGVNPGTLRIAVEAVENGKMATKVVEVNVKNYAPVADKPVPGWGFSQADLDGQLTFDVDNGYFTELYENGDFSYDITGVSFNGGAYMSLDGSGIFQLIGDNLTIVNKYLAAGTYRFALTATDQHGGTSAPVFITLVVAPGNVSPVDGGTITVTTGSDDNDIAAAAGAINMHDGVSRDELQMAWDLLNEGAGISLREAVWFAELTGSQSNNIVFGNGTASVNLDSTLVINSSVSFGNVDITGKGIQIGSNAVVSLSNVELSGITDSSVITNRGTLNLSVAHIHDNSLTGAVINTVAGGSTTITNASIINNTASGLVIDGAASVRYSTIIDNGPIAVSDQAVLTGVVTSPANIVINPATGSYNYGIVNGVMILDDNVAGAGADHGLESIPHFTVRVTDLDGFDIAPGDVLRGDSNVKGGMYYWYVNGVLTQGGISPEYIVLEADRGSVISVKYIVTDASGFMGIQQVVTPPVSTDSTAPDRPVADYDGNEMDATPEFSGKAEANSRVIITINGVQSIVMADASGNWAFESKYLHAGDYTVSIISRDAADNDSISYTIDMMIAEGARDENPLVGDMSTTPSGSVFVPGAEPVEVYTNASMMDVDDAAPEYTLQDLGAFNYGESNLVFSLLGEDEDFDLDEVDLNGDGIIDDDELSKFFAGDDEDSVAKNEDSDDDVKESEHTLENAQKVSRTFRTSVQNAIAKLIEGEE